MIKTDFKTELVDEKIQYNWNVVGDSEFSSTPIIFDEHTFEPYQIFSFKLCVECKQDLLAIGHLKNEDAIEKIAEKVKQDFINFVSKNSLEKK